MKIFISIASYRDPLLQTTVTEAYNNAKFKESLVFCIVDQSPTDETIRLNSLPFKNQIRYIRFDPIYARGSCWPRTIAQSYWSGEDYFMQLDSHTMFDTGWDETLINQYKELEKYHPKPLITAYPHSFEVVNNDITNLHKTKYSGLLALIIRADSFKQNLSDIFLDIHINIVGKNKPVHGFMFSGNFSFCAGKICEEVPNDPFMYFSGEEHAIALRAWTHGYNIFHVPDLPIYTHYGRDYRPVVWGDQENIRPVKWWEYDKRSKERLITVLTGGDVGKYGLGKERTLAQYIKWSGIDYINRTLTPNARTGCDSFELDYKEQIRI